MKLLQKNKKWILWIVFGIVIALIVGAGLSVPGAFLCAWMISILLCLGTGTPFSTLQKGMAKYVGDASFALFFMFCTGAMMGVLNQCGTIPMLTKLGLSVVPPSLYLPAAFIVCFLFSFLIGTVFGAAGTIGIVFMTIGEGFGIPAQEGAAAIMMGCFFGFVFSPLSDGVNIASDLSGLSRNLVVRSLRRVIVPFSVIVFLMLLVQSRMNGLSFQADMKDLPLFAGVSLKLNAITVIPLVLVLVMLALHMSAIVAIIGGIIAAVPISIFVQHQSPAVVLDSMWNGSVLTSGNESFDAMFSRGGVVSVSGTLLLLLLVFSLFGMLQSCGILDEALAPLTAAMKTESRASFLAVLVGALATACAASAVCSLIFTLHFLTPIYQKHAWRRDRMVRAAIVGCFCMSLLVPWHSNAITPSAFWNISSFSLVARMWPVLILVPILFVIERVEDARHPYRQVLAPENRG